MNPINKTDVPQALPFTRADIEQTVPARFEQTASHFSNHLALTGNGRRWTYRDLNRQVNRMAHAIRESTPAGPGCVVYLLDHSPEMVIATIAVLKAGKTYLAIHPAMPAPAQLEIVKDVEPDLVLTNATSASRANELASGTCPILNIDSIDERWPDKNPEPVTKPNDPSTIFYTSGTTGQPKGVVKSHRAVLHRVWLSTQHDVITPADRQSLLTHCSFSASESDIFGALLQGATLCVFDIASQGLAAFGAWLESEQITLLHPPALLFRRFLSTLEGQNLFPSVRLVALAGDVVLPADLEKWRRHFTKSCKVLHRFSITETALLTVALIDSDGVLDSSIVPAGRAVADKSLALVDEAGQPVPEGETGELIVTSSFIAEGYWRRPEETAAVFKANADVSGQRTYRTGDLGRFLPDGSLVFLGRRDHQVKIRGYRVDTREVESALLHLNEVQEAAIIVRKGADEKQLEAFVVMKLGVQFDASALRERLKTYLPDWKIPARFQAISFLPITLTGKVDRQRLEAEARPAVPPKSSRTGSSATIEEELAEIWREAIGLEVIGYDDNFLQLGGDSISMMIAVNRIERRYGIRVAPAEFYQLGTVRQLAGRIGNLEAGAKRVETQRRRRIRLISRLLHIRNIPLL